VAGTIAHLQYELLLFLDGTRILHQQCNPLHIALAAVDQEGALRVDQCCLYCGHTLSARRARTASATAQPNPSSRCTAHMHAGTHSDDMRSGSDSSAPNAARGPNAATSNGVLSHCSTLLPAGRRTAAGSASGHGGLQLCSSAPLAGQRDVARPDPACCCWMSLARSMLHDCGVHCKRQHGAGGCVPTCCLRPDGRRSELRMLRICSRYCAFTFVYTP
jgi:hypothetical protein